jgi:hypothetical protein
LLLIVYGEKRGKIDEMFFCCRFWQLFTKILWLFSKILSIKLSLKVEIILLRKYNMIFNVKMLEPMGKGNLCIVVVCMAKTNNQQGYKTSTTPK